MSESRTFGGAAHFGHSEIRLFGYPAKEVPIVQEKMVAQLTSTFVMMSGPKPDLPSYGPLSNLQSFLNTHSPSEPVHQVAMGWPLPSLYYTNWGGLAAPAWFAELVGVEPAWVCRLPVRPIWPGIAVNTLCFAAPVFIMVAVPPAVRRRSDRRRGLCPQCTYDLRGDLPSGCPECGWNRARTNQPSEPGTPGAQAHLTPHPESNPPTP